MLKLIKILFLILLANVVYSQQLPQLSQRIVNQMIFNPAATGINPSDEIMLQHRSQWLGFENAPMTQTLSYNGKLLDYMGIGGSVTNDITGPTRRLCFQANYAYHVKFETITLSLGLSGTIMQYGIDGRNITLYDKTDPSIQEDISDRAWKPDASFGAYVYNDNFYVGLSFLQILPSKVKLYNDDYTGEVPLVNHFYITSGYHIIIDDEFTLTPSFMFNSTFSSPSQLDINARVDYQKKVFGAISYRYNDAIVLMAGITIKQQFNISYSYDIVTSSLRTYNSGSHEIVLSFLLPDNSTKDGSSLL
ncbi:MAG: type IX secretion system membrane protein PorP/SprF [Marinilabiliales bacterium]